METKKEQFRKELTSRALAALNELEEIEFLTKGAVDSSGNEEFKHWRLDILDCVGAAIIKTENLKGVI